MGEIKKKKRKKKHKVPSIKQASSNLAQHLGSHSQVPHYNSGTFINIIIIRLIGVLNTGCDYRIPVPNNEATKSDKVHEQQIHTRNVVVCHWLHLVWMTWFCSWILILIFKNFFCFPFPWCWHCIPKRTSHVRVWRSCCYSRGWSFCCIWCWCRCWRWFGFPIPINKPYYCNFKTIALIRLMTVIHRKCTYTSSTIDLTFAASQSVYGFNRFSFTSILTYNRLIIIR